jgi:hypothetical protein
MTTISAASGGTTLRSIIESAAESNGKPLKDLTVLSTGRDPYRLDTPSFHLLSQWLLDAWRQVCPDGRPIHSRGLHYRLVGQVTKPDGQPYLNNDETWTWLSEKAIKAARFLGYLPWEALRDARITPPEWYEETFNPPQWRIVTEDVFVALPDNLEPRLVLEGDLCRQPWQQVIIAEKQGVGDLLRPVAKARHASLVLPSGELGDGTMYEILRRAAADGRPLAIHQLGDFDPAGHQMAVSTARTAQAIRDSKFPDLTIRVHAVALTLDQVREWQLPSTPLKETERRADKWQEATGWEQTELDAAVALVPHRFQAAVRQSLDQYWDGDVANRARTIKDDLVDKANARLAATIGEETLAAIRYQAELRLADLEELVEEINEALLIDPTEAGVEIPPDPEVIIGDWNVTQAPLLDTADDWSANTRRLIARKKYEASIHD